MKNSTGKNTADKGLKHLRSQDYRRQASGLKMLKYAILLALILYFLIRIGRM
ncbi:MAG: hypothetical protein GXO91_00340 [FCB group bacterium]|nr:hypothetical protein [FCB group bacterium]